MLTIVNPENEHTALTWDALDREIHRVLANEMAISHTFNAAVRETLQAMHSASNVLQVSYQGTDDPVSNRLTSVEADGTHVAYPYDADNQLVNEQGSGGSAYNTTHQYDPAGSRLLKNESGQQTGYSYNAANELTLLRPPAGQPTTRTWDGNGHLLVENRGGALRTYSWDGENRLLGIAFSNGHRETYSYAADGLRREKVDVSGLQYLFVWDEENLLLWTDQTLAVQDQFTQYPGVWGGLISQRRPGASYYYGFDLQGSVRAMPQQSGSIGDKYTYKAFGEQIAQSGSNVNLYHFGGQWG